jgi:hypothetical protein
MLPEQDAPRPRDRRRTEHTMRTFQTTLVLEVIVFGALFLLASAAAAMVIAGFDAPPPAGDEPRRDGRYSLGQATGCEELLHKLEREEEQRLRYREPERQVPDPRRDGRYSEGRPATCAEPRKRPRREVREVREGRAEREGRGERQLSPG